MDTIYSLSLLVALIAGGGGCAAALAAALAARRARTERPWLSRACLLCGLVSLIAGLLSILVHMTYGHGPRSLEPMTVTGFFLFHKAYWAVLVLTLLSLAGWTLSHGT